MTPRTHLSTLTFVVVSLTHFGCGTQEPTSTDTNSDTETTLPSQEDYFPLAVGNHWSYEETTVDGAKTSFTNTVMEKTTMIFDHDVGEKEVYVLKNDLSTSTEEGRTQYYADDGDRVVRLRQIVEDKTGTATKQRDYVPGFLRFDRTKTTKGDEWTESFTAYTDTMDGSPLSAQTVQYRFEILEDHQEVVVPAGTFDCLVVQRTGLTGSKNDVKQYFFAKGVGKVKEITSGEKEELLTSYSIEP